ncbi:hypothetical protein MRX96_011985 [Rhipicephalus microplus]
MYNGSIISWGSPSFLKNACGVGYKLRIEKEQTVFNSELVLAVVKNAVPQATIEEEKENEAIIALNTMERNDFPALFRELEGGSERLGIRSTGLTVATMQDVYIKIYTEWVGGQKDELSRDEGHRATEILMVNLVPRNGLLAVIRSQVAPPKQSYIKLSTMFATKATEPSTKTFIREDTADNNSLRYKGLLKSEDIPCDFAANVLGTLLEKYHENYFEYLSTYAFGSVFNNTVIEMWTNPLSLLGSWILQNLIDTTLLIQQTGQPNARFDTGISVVQMTTEEAKDGGSKSEGPLEEVKDFIMYNWLYWGLLMPMSIGLITSSFVVNPSNEILNEARDLQLMTGVSGCLYIGTNFVFDLLFYMTPLTAIYFGFATAFNLSSSTHATLVLVMLSSAPVNIFLPYLICEHSADGGSSYAAILGIYAVGGPALVLAYLFTTTFNEERDWRTVFLFFPPFQLPAASVRAVSFEKEMKACDYMRQKKSRDGIFCWFAGKFSSCNQTLLRCSFLFYIQCSNPTQNHGTTFIFCPLPEKEYFTTSLLC